MKTLSKIASLILMALGMALSVPATAGEEAKGDKAGEGGDPYVKLASAGIPIMVDSRVVNYIFVTVKINLTPKASMTKLREKEPYFRDALVRTANKISFGQKTRDDLIDEVRFKTAMMPVFSQIAGPGAIDSIEIVTQMPSKKRGPLPRP